MRLFIGRIKRKNILFEVYPYPIVEEEYQYGDSVKSLTFKHMQRFLETYHAIAVFTLTIPKKDKMEMRAKIIHSLYNMDQKSYEYEGMALNGLALNRMRQIGQMEGMAHKEISKRKDYLKNRGKK